MRGGTIAEPVIAQVRTGGRAPSARRRRTPRTGRLHGAPPTRSTRCSTRSAPGATRSPRGPAPPATLLVLAARLAGDRDHRGRRGPAAAAAAAGHPAGDRAGRAGAHGRGRRLRPRRSPAAARRSSRRSAGDVDAMRRQIATELAEVREARRQVEWANEQLEQQAEELTRSNRDLEQFAYVASHDLQEPLRKVASFCQLLQRRYAGQLDERADQYIAFAVDGAQRMQRLINDLLAFSRIGRLTSRLHRRRPEPVLAEVAAQFEARRATTGAEIICDRPAHGARARSRCSPRCSCNLIGNALKFRRPGRTAAHRGSAPSASATSGRSPCADNGIGIEPEFADKVFVIFQRLHARDAYRGHRHRPGDRQEDRRIPWRPDLARPDVSRGHARSSSRSRVPVSSDAAPATADLRESTVDDRHDQRGRHADRGAAGRGRPGRRADDAGGVRGAQGPQPAHRRLRRRGGAGLPAPRGPVRRRGPARPDPARPQPAAARRPRGARRDQEGRRTCAASRSWC